MSFEARFTVPTVPVAKGRPQFFRVGKGVRAVTPEKTREAEATFAALAARYRPDKPLAGPVSVALEFVFLPSRSWPAWQREAAQRNVVRHTGRPDTENLAKLALDAMTTGGWWEDDSQVVEVDARKVYGLRPETRVTVLAIWEPSTAKEWRALEEGRVHDLVAPAPAEAVTE